MHFANSQAGYNKFMDMVRGLSEPVVFGMEATGHYWLTLYTHLCNDGYTVHVNQPFGRFASAQIGMKVCRQTAAFLVELY